MIKKTKFNKESRNLLIGMIIGDGTIMKSKYSYSMKLQHGRFQKEYLEWKMKMLDLYGIPHSELKTYKMKTNFTKGEYWDSYAVYLKSNPFIGVLRRVVYTNNGKELSRKLLNRLTPLGIAIWYMDDGGINYKKKTNSIGQRVIYSAALRLSTCTTKEIAQRYIDYFKEVWNINFYTFKEGKNRDKFSLMCGTKEAEKFLNIIKIYINQISSMSYKSDLMIGHICDCTPMEETGNTLKESEDIV